VSWKFKFFQRQKIFFCFVFVLAAASLIISACFYHTAPSAEAPTLIVAICTIVATDAAGDEALFVIKLVTLATADTFTRLIVPQKVHTFSLLAPRADMGALLEGHRISAPRAGKYLALATTVATPEGLD
jgi:hypothetical protein